MLFLLINFINFSAFSQVAPPSAAALQSDFKSMATKNGMSPLGEQAFCYDQGGVKGYQVDKLQRIASLTKLITTYLASETMDLNKKFETKLFISDDRLHITGGRDPYFEEEKLLLLMEALNDLKYTNFKSVTFDSHFIFSDAALSSHQEITPSHTRARLAYYFNPANAKGIKNAWLVTAQFAKEEGISIDKSRVPSIRATTVSLSEVNPLKDLAPTVLIHKSRPFRDILKSMNVQSKNIVAHNVFLEASRIRTLESLMTSVGVDKSLYKIYNGSGLPVKTSSSRVDNLATCKIILKVMSLLSKSLPKHKLELSDIVAVNGGKDLGSFRERFLTHPQTHEAVISKTGTIMHASALAGVLLIDGEVPFAILNHTSNSSSARKFQDLFVARMFHHLGEPTPLVYEKIQIFPWDGSDFLERLFTN